MNKNLTWIVLGLAVILLLWWLFARGSGGTSTEDQGTTDQNAQTQSGTSRTSIEKLLAAGRSVQCSFSSNEGGVASSGKVYVSGQKVRTDFESKEGKGHMISDGKMAYVWMDGQNTGFKVSVDQADDEMSTPTASAPDMSAEGDYDCSAWVATAASFNPPTNVNFSNPLDALSGIKY